MMSMYCLRSRRPQRFPETSCDWPKIKMDVINELLNIVRSVIYSFGLFSEYIILHVYSYNYFQLAPGERFSSLERF